METINISWYLKIHKLKKSMYVYEEKALCSIFQKSEEETFFC